MPRGNGTGPMGMGPMTGRGGGFCTGYPKTGFMNGTVGYGWGSKRGFGRGFGYRNMYNITGLPRWARQGYFAKETADQPEYDEKKILSTQAEILENQLQQVKKRLDELNKDDNNLEENQ